MKKVKCIDDSGGGLSIIKGEIYTVDKEDKVHYFIFGVGWFKNRFEVISETLPDIETSQPVSLPTEPAFDFAAYNGLKRTR